MGDSQAMFHQRVPQNKNDHTSCPLGINVLLWEANLFGLTLKVKSNTSVWAGHHIYFNLWNSHGWSPLQQGWLCPNSTHLPGVPKTDEQAWLAPPFHPGVSTHSQTMMAKTEHSNPEMTHLFISVSFFHTTVGAPTSGVEWVTPESKHHPLSVYPLLNYHSQKIPKSLYFH